MNVLYPRCCGLDIHKKTVVACVRIAEGDKVVARWKWSGTHTGNWVGIPPTNKEASCGGTYTFRIVDGKVVEQWTHWGAFGLYVQLGLVPPWKEIVDQAKSKQA